MAPSLLTDSQMLRQCSADFFFSELVVVVGVRGAELHGLELLCPFMFVF